MKLCSAFRIAVIFLTAGFLRAAESPYNVVLIFADDLGWRDVAWQSDGFLETPHLAKLKSQSMNFTRAYASAGNCAPSRACLLSGKYTPRHGVYAVGSTDRGPREKFRLEPVPNNTELAPSFVTVAEKLKEAGYATGHFGKWHIGTNKTGTGPKDQGFENLGAQVGPNSVAQDDAPTDTDGKKGRKNRTTDRKPEQDPKHIFGITAAACSFMERHKDRPFFAYVAHHAIHTPLEARAESIAKFQAKKIPAGLSALHAACLYDLDESIGILLQKIADLGLEHKTLVVFTSDNGSPTKGHNEPLRGAKGAYYEGGIREPMLVRLPGVIPAGSECSVPVSNVDFYPTFLEAAGIKPAGLELDGESLFPLFDGKGKLQRASLFWHFPGYLDNPVTRGRDPVFRTRPVSVITQGDWKLLLYHEEWLLDGGKAKLDTNKAVELYHLATDPGEHHDVAAKETAKRDALLAELLAWMEKAKAPLPQPLKTAATPKPEEHGYEDREMLGWKLRINKKLLAEKPELTAAALEMIEAQLKTICEVVPKEAVAKLKTVPMWISPPYKGFGSRAEYHPDAGWLKENGRDPAMAKSVEFTNVDVFKKDCERMPMLVLHELAHAYHDQALGFENKEIEATFQAAVKSESYNAVKHYDGSIRKAYAMTDAKEYFAETTEAYFGKNDIFPFNREELKKHDPAIYVLLEELWGVK